MEIQTIGERSEQMREVAIIGAGLHPWGRFGKSFLDLGVVAVRNTLEDAGVGWEELNAVVAGQYIWDGEAGRVAGQSLAHIMGETGIPILNVYNMCATGSSVFRTACMTIASGEYDMVLAFAAEVPPEGFIPTTGVATPTDPSFLRWKMLGLSNPGYWALDCRRRMETYGTTELHLAKAKAVVSKFGALNPYARFKKEFTIEAVLNSPMVADPLRLLEICPTSDGAAAVVLCSMEKAKQFTKHPVIVAGTGLGSSVEGDIACRLGLLSYPSKQEAPFLSESAMASKAAYEHAGIGPEEIDVLELPDNSSWHYLQYLEILGFCGPGEADQLLDEDETILGGKIPVNPSGGLASFGEAVSVQGLAQICEIAWQLRGDSGPRQIPGAKVGMAQTYGMLGNSGSAILKK